MLARAVRQGRSTGAWNTMPTSRIGRSTRRPRMCTAPAVGATSPATIRSAVDLPQPLGPTSVTNSSSPTSNDSRSSGAPVSKTFVRRSTLIAAVAGMPARPSSGDEAGREGAARGQGEVQLKGLLHEVDGPLQPVRGGDPVAVLLHVGGLDRLDRLVPLGQRGVVVEGGVVLHHDLGGLLGA